MDGIRLNKLIEHLEGIDQNAIVCDGFGEPSSYRGYYNCVAFHPVNVTTVGEMLKHARSAVGKTFTGYKGGEFTMNLETPCYIACYKNLGDPITNFHLKRWKQDAEK